MAINDKMNKTFREFRRYAGDGKEPPVSSPLPIGDPSSGLHNPSSAEIRDAFGTATQELDAAVETASTYAGTAVAAADTAVAVSGDVVPTYATRDIMGTLTIPAGRLYAWVSGRSAIGDGLAGLYVRVASEPTSADKIRSVDRFLPNGSTSTANGGWWERRGTVPAFSTSDEVNVLDYIPRELHAGIAAGTGATNLITYLQAAATDALASGRTIYAPAGVYRYSGTLSLSNTGTDPTRGNRPALRGDGMGATRFLVDNAGGQSAIVITNTWGTNEQVRMRYQGFSLQRNGSAKQGVGIDLTACTYLAFDHVNIERFYMGVRARDVICCEFNKGMIGHNGYGVFATRLAFSHPNAWTFNQCVINANTELGLSFQKPAVLNVYGGTFEGNGVGGVEGMNGGIYINANPDEGAVGLNASGVYFEGNKGQGDVVIDCNDGDSAAHMVSGCTFNRLNMTNYVTHNIALIKGGGGKLRVIVVGCGFRGFNTYTANAARRYISFIGTPIDTNHAVVASPTWNMFGSTTEEPTISAV